ncbi:dnaJ homolog subfamily C member 2 [Eupeodes corollae]|uniref:dnaJ homolog subfamily C member 2 n=1 Tax=Eupeodes corollae TaxID=290404 RepID=UPI002491E04A|nr:dnaJ homolog subfamily C member 2 [Eupeodes corollae]
MQLSSESHILSFNLISKEVQRVGLRFQKFAGRHDAPRRIKSENLKKWDSNDLDIDINYLRSLDPKEWKDQDHYAVLGLGSLRYNATDDDIRRAYRKMVLQHHPDKRKAKGEEVNADTDYFTCITKAYEILGTQKTRRAYDSVDPKFDDNLPSQSAIENNYYDVFNKYFGLNARWSERKNVPVFGNEDAKREDVDHFYSFWYDFESWREFSYLDEEDKEKGQDRDERRWIEKQNKVARIKRKKEEMSRIRALVDLAYNNDKRITKFKNEEKQRKLALKRAKMDAAQAQKEEMERVVKEAQLAKEKADKAEQKRIEKIRVEREQYKKAMKKERKMLRDRARENNYYSATDKDVLRNMEGVERVCETLTLAELQDLNRKIEENSSQIFFDVLKEIDNRLSKEREESSQAKIENRSSLKSLAKIDPWTNDSIQILIKAVNLFPAGTAQRWDVIATFMNQHANSEVNFTSRDVLSKAKSLQQGDFSKSTLKTEANDAAFQSFQKSKKEIQVVPDNVLAEEYDTATANSNTNNINNNKKKSPPPSAPAPAPTPAATTPAAAENIAPTLTPTAPAAQQASNKTPTVQNSSAKTWTKEEQALLEQAIKSFPISTPERWERIAECIPNRSKKDCLKRVKELVDLVNSKKDAKQATK